MSTTPVKEDVIIQTLRLVDPFLVFLTKKSGHIFVSLTTLAKALPPPVVTPQTLLNIHRLVELGILRLNRKSISSVSATESSMSWSDAETQLGFPPQADAAEETPPQKELRQGLGSLHGSTKTGFMRRLKALTRVLYQQRRQQQQQVPEDGFLEVPHEDVKAAFAKTLEPLASLGQPQMLAGASQLTSEKAFDDCNQKSKAAVEITEQVLSEEAIQAQQDLEHLLGFASKQSSKPISDPSNSIPTCILDGQISYAGTHPAQQSVYDDLSESTLEQIPSPLLAAFGMSAPTNPRRLYRHQTRAIEAALAEKHCTVCTGTGSGKSMCFLLPVLTAAYQGDRVSFILYPTKALAQDQLTQLQSLLSKEPSLAAHIRPATLDGDTPHSTRTIVADTANVILTNPDTLHASILPNWKYMYSKLLSRLAYVALDEAHLYEGIFGAHVTMILSRLLRLSVVAANHQGLPPSLPTFIATSATMPWPEELFRRLCPIAKDAPVVVLTAEQDGSPRSAKHFFLWNPPLLQCLDRTSTGQVVVAKATDLSLGSNGEKKRKRQRVEALNADTDKLSWDALEQLQFGHAQSTAGKMYRRHAAEETALLLARALVTGSRCIAFCRTRNLVEWVYERTISALKLDPATAHLVDRLDSYRGGYCKEERREIEQKLFRGELLGVVGTNALELGVDIGGINLTLHCGYPSSYSSLLQQAGRAGRDKTSINMASCSVVICFDSPVEQHMWRRPKSLLSIGISPSSSIPITSGIVQSHLLCASEEFPISQTQSVSHVLGEREIACPSDRFLLGGEVFDDAFDELVSSRGLVKTEVNVPDGTSFPLYQVHYSHRKPWAKVSIRAIEPVSYTLVNMAHAGQSGRTDALHHEGAVMDTIPYSRVFYYSHPGAIILHRGTRYKIIAMSAPPPLCHDMTYRSGSLFLAAFAKPTKANYFTRPISNTCITVVKSFQRVELMASEMSPIPDILSTDGNGDMIRSDGDEGSPRECIENKFPPLTLSFAGCGTITVKRRIYGYTTLSLITRAELSRSELTLPEFEYDTFGIWLDIDRDALLPRLGERDFGAGVHALSHALLAVAPIFVPGVVRQDLECDHSHFDPTRIMLFDERAGGSGACQRLWNILLRRDSVIEAAVELLEGCRSCSTDTSYDGGCPACLQASNCLKFNLHLSRSAGAVIGRHLLSRVRLSGFHIVEGQRAVDEEAPTKDSTPRRRARDRGLRRAKEMHGARDRQFVVGRPSWPL